LEISPQDPKALYRRASALEGLEKYEEAYRDAQKALISSPADSATFQPLLSRLHVLVEQRRVKFTQIKEKASRMMKLAFEGEAGEEERETGLNNVLVLCRERAGIEALLDLGLLLKLKSLVDLKSPTVPDMKRKITAVRTLSEIVRFNVSMVS
jgi:tetratricopeptide (TPR) repeat protein